VTISCDADEVVFNRVLLVAGSLVHCLDCNQAAPWIENGFNTEFHGLAKNAGLYCSFTSLVSQPALSQQRASDCCCDVREAMKRRAGCRF
jgi:hypothetical protein